MEPDGPSGMTAIGMPLAALPVSRRLPPLPVGERVGVRGLSPVHHQIKKIILGIFTSPPTRAIIPPPRPKLRGATGAADRAGRGAVAMSWGVTHPRMSRPKPGVPGPQSRGPLGSGSRVPNWLTRADLPAAEDSKCHSSGGRSEQAYKHRVWGAGERRIDWLTEACTTFSHNRCRRPSGRSAPAPHTPFMGEGATCLPELRPEQDAGRFVVGRG